VREYGTASSKIKRSHVLEKEIQAVKQTIGQAAPSKYRNQKTECNGIQFDSRKEAGRYQELLMMQRAGQICHIEIQPRYDLVVNGSKLGFYRADFRYEVVATGVQVTEDVKSKATKTAVYCLKKKLVKALYGVEIVEV
jgi:hypothetical protein